MRDADSPHRMVLGPSEKALASLAIAAIVGVPAYLWQKAELRADRQEETLQQVDTRTQVMTQQMATITAQLADAASVRDKAAENRVRIQALEEQVRELRQMRGLK